MGLILYRPFRRACCVEVKAGAEAKNKAKTKDEAEAEDKAESNASNENVREALRPMGRLFFHRLQRGKHIEQYL